MKLASLALTATLCFANTVKAESFQLETSGNEPLYQTSLPKEVYQCSRSNALQDLTIINASGEQVPYALLPYESLHEQVATSMLVKPLSIFPIKESSLNNTRDLSIQIEKSTVNASIYIDTDKTNLNEKTVYLVDAGKKHPPLQTLHVDWQNSAGKLLSVDVLASDDLKNWSNVGYAVLLKTSADGKALLQNSITLNSPTEARYLQIRPAENDIIGLTKINAEYNSERSLSPATLWQEVSFLQREQDDEAGIVNLDFEATGRFPASRLRVHLPLTNTITNASIFVRNHSNDAWQPLTTASLYRMEKSGKSYTSPDILINTSTSRYWRLQFYQANGGIGQKNPQLSLGWLPQTLVWNARGQGPFTLQVGQNPQIINNVSVTGLIPDYKIERVLQLPKANLTLQAGSLAGQIEKSGSTWTSAPDYKRWFLWGGLFLGVVLLAGMAYSLVKSERIK